MAGAVLLTNSIAFVEGCSSTVFCEMIPIPQLLSISVRHTVVDVRIGLTRALHMRWVSDTSLAVIISRLEGTLAPLALSGVPATQALIQN